MNSMCWSNEQYHSNIRPTLLRDLLVTCDKTKSDPFPLGPDISRPQVVMSQMNMEDFIGMSGLEAAQSLVPIICKLHDVVSREHYERRRK